MRNRTHCPTTRASLTATAAYNTRWFASIIAGTTVLGASLQAAEWDGETSPDWNVFTNWDGDIGTGGTHAIINTKVPNIATISADLIATPLDIIVGTGAGSDGQVNHTAGIANTGGVNWAYVGTDGGTGVYNLANTAAAGGGITGFGQGSGTLNVGNDMHVGSFNAGGSDGTLNIHTTGAVNAPGVFTVGRGTGSVGVVNLESGILATGNYTRFGFNSESEGAGTGTLNMTGGTINKTGDEHFVIGDGADAVGIANVSGGTINVNNEIWVGQNGADGTLNFSAGTVTNNSWVAIGRDGGTGHVDMTGGTWTKTGGGNFIVGASGPGTMDQSGGLVDVQGGITWIGEVNGSSGTLTLTEDAEFRTSVFSLAVQANTTGILNLDGGTAVTSQFTGGDGDATVNFNGTQIIASADNGAFINNLDTATIGGGGLLVDSDGFNLSSTQALDGTGGVVKSGAGTLALMGANSYAGTTVVEGGTFNLSTDSTLAGAVSVANGAALGVSQSVDTGVLDLSNLTFGESELTVTAAPATGNPAAALLNVTGTMTVNGDVTVNLVDEEPVVGLFPTISYAAKAGTGGFVPGTVPDGVTLNSVSPVVDSGTLVSLNIERVNAPFWTGDVNNVWNTTTLNWENSFNGNATTYFDGDPVLFEDNENVDPLSKAVTLNTTVSPGGSGVTVFNDFDDYSITGSGTISGSSGLTKRGFAGLTLGTLNDFTGPAVLEEGLVSVGLLANAGDPSPLGAGDLILAGATLNYTGAPVSINRGFTVDASDGSVISEISLANDVTMSGPVTANLGKLSLSGPGVLTLTHAGPISLTNGPQDGDPATLLVNGGGLTLAGTGQTAEIVGNTQIGVAANSTTEFTVSGDTVVTLNRFQVGFGVDSNSSVLVEGNAAINKVGGSWLSIANSNNAVATMTVRDSGSFTTDVGDFNVGDTASSNGTLILEDSATVTSAGPVFIGKNGTTGTVDLSGDSAMTSGITEVAGGADSTGTLTLRGTSSYTSNGQLLVGPGVGSDGEVVIEDTGGMVVNSFVSVGFNGGGDMTIRENGSFSNNDDFSVNENGDVPAIVTVEDDATMSVAGTLYVGRNTGRVGTLNVTGTASLDQTDPAFSFIVGPAGNGTLNVQESASVSIAATSGMVLTNTASGTATVNLDGGSLTTNRISDAGGVSTFNFNGGLLVAGADSNLDYMSNLDEAFVLSGGAFIDTNGETIAIGQVLLDGSGGGGLTKSGAGFLQLNGANTYTGTTTVTGGALGGDGSVAGPLVVNSGATIAPGASVGTFSAGATTISGTYVAEIDGASSDLLAVNGALDISGATLDVGQLGAPSAGALIIASYTSLNGTFAQELNLPGDYTVDYNYQGGNQIALVGTPVASSYDTWASGFGLDPETDGAAGFDADDDGQVNSVEFALGGDPTDGADNAKVYSLVGDSDADTEDELLMTIAVLAGTEAFAGSPSPTATEQGFTYTIEGSLTLDGFPETVTPVAPVTTGLPAAPAGYEYRTFSLAGSNGLPSQGFLRVDVSEVVAE